MHAFAVSTKKIPRATKGYTVTSFNIWFYDIAMDHSIEKAMRRHVRVRAHTHARQYTHKEHRFITYTSLAQ